MRPKTPAKRRIFTAASRGCMPAEEPRGRQRGRCAAGSSSVAENVTRTFKSRRRAPFPPSTMKPRLPIPRAASGLACLVAVSLLASTARAETSADPPSAASPAVEPPVAEAPAAEPPPAQQAIAEGSSPALVPAELVLAVPSPAEPSSVGPPAPQHGPEKPPPTSRYTSRGLLGPVRAGPTVGLGVPDGVRFGAFAKWRGILGGGAAFSLLPQTTVPGVNAQIVRASGEVLARVHPFRGAFFLGVAGGYAQTKGTMTEQTFAFRQSQRVLVNAYASALYVAPQLGFQWMLPLGLTIGFDAGVEIPVAASGPTFDATRYGLVVPIEAKGRVAAATRYVTTRPVPVVHLLEVGYAL